MSRGIRGLLADMRRIATLVAAIAVAGAAAWVLETHAEAGVRSIGSLSSRSAVQLARTDDAFYACLSAQAHKLAPAGTTVEIPADPPGDWITLAKAVAQWAPLVASASRANVVLKLEGSDKKGSCLGDVVRASPGGMAAVPQHSRGGSTGSSRGGS